MAELVINHMYMDLVGLGHTGSSRVLDAFSVRVPFVGADSSHQSTSLHVPLTTIVCYAVGVVNQNINCWHRWPRHPMVLSISIFLNDNISFRRKLSRINSSPHASRPFWC